MSLLGIIFLFAIVDLILSSLALMLASLMTNLFIVSNIALMVVNALFIPLFIFTISFLYLQWKDEKLQNNKGEKRFHYKLG